MRRSVAAAAAATARAAPPWSDFRAITCARSVATVAAAEQQLPPVSDAGSATSCGPVLGEVDRMRMAHDLAHIRRKVFPPVLGVRRTALLVPFCHVGGASSARVAAASSLPS